MFMKLIKGKSHVRLGKYQNKAQSQEETMSRPMTGAMVQNT